MSPVSLSLFLPSHQGLSSPDKALPSPIAPPSSALCLGAQRHFLQDPFLIPAPSVASGAPFTATLHPELGLVSGMGLRAEKGNTGPLSLTEEKSWAPAVPAPKYSAGHTSVPSEGLSKPTDLMPMRCNVLTLDR